MGCCNAKAKKPDGGSKVPQKAPRDKYGRPMHRARGPIFEQAKEVYSDMKGMAELACKDPANFIELTRRSDVKDFSKYTGFDLAAERSIIL